MNKKTEINKTKHKILVGHLKQPTPFSPKGSEVMYNTKFGVFQSWNPKHKTWAFLFGDSYENKNEWIEKIANN